MNYEYAAPERHWSYTQKAVIAIVPKVSSSLSIIGSSFILYKIISPTNKNRDFFQSVRNNLLVLLSCCDLLSSCGYFLSTWALPSDDPQNIVGMYVCSFPAEFINYKSSASAKQGWVFMFMFLCHLNKVFSTTINKRLFISDTFISISSFQCRIEDNMQFAGVYDSFWYVIYWVL